MEGKLVRLRAYERSDAAEVVKWANDEEVTQFLGPHLIYPTSAIEFEKWLETNADGSASEKAFVIEARDGKYLGSIALTDIDWVDRSAEVHIIIGDRTSWGKGLGADAMRVLLRSRSRK